MNRPDTASDRLTLRQLAARAATTDLERVLSSHDAPILTTASFTSSI